MGMLYMDEVNVIVSDGFLSSIITADILNREKKQFLHGKLVNIEFYF